MKRTSLPTRDAVLVSRGPWSVWVVLFQTHTQVSSLYYVLTLTLSALTMHVDIQYFFPQSRVIFSAGLHSTSARLFEQLQSHRVIVVLCVVVRSHLKIIFDALIRSGLEQELDALNKHCLG